MANKTKKYNLIKPLESEFYDVEVQNENMDKIDAALEQLTEKAEALSNALKREKVIALPSTDGTVLAMRTQPYTGTNMTDSNLITTNWISLDTSADLSPVTEAKRIRMKVTLESTDGQIAAYSGGEIRLRYHEADENKVTCSLNDILWQEGENQLDIPLTLFTPANSPSWSNIDEIIVFTYAANQFGSYSITISDLRIVDASVGIDPYTIYMVPSTAPQAENAYTEYMYIDYKWERLGGEECPNSIETGTATLTCTSGVASEKFDCTYTKTGNMVTLRGSGYNITGTWGTGVTFTGLPFTCHGVSGFVWKSNDLACFWGFGYLSGNSLNICKEIAYSPYEPIKTNLTGPYVGTGFTVTYITGS